MCTNKQFSPLFWVISWSFPVEEDRKVKDEMATGQLIEGMFLFPLLAEHKPYGRFQIQPRATY